jgi:hypothetical protein
MRSSTSSAGEHRICSVCRLHSVEYEDHSIFECPVYRFLRTVEYPDLFVGHHSLRSFLAPRQTSRGLLVTLETAFGHGHMCGHLSLSLYGSYGTIKIIIIIIIMSCQAGLSFNHIDFGIFHRLEPIHRGSF